jgi:hypothetical protein
MLLAPAWWPLDDDNGEPMMAKVSFASEEKDGRQVWLVSFEMEGDSLGLVAGDVMSNSKALSASIRMENREMLSAVRENLPALREDLSELPLALQYIGVGALERDERSRSLEQGLDMEA